MHLALLRRPCLVRCTLHVRLLIHKSNHVLVFLRHDSWCHAFRLANHIAELAHWNTVFLLPVQDSVEIPALAIDAEVGIWFITNINPVVDEWVSIGSARQRLKEGVNTVTDVHFVI